MRGVRLEDIMIQGRWESDKTIRHYVQIGANTLIKMLSQKSGEWERIVSIANEFPEVLWEFFDAELAKPKGLATKSRKGGSVG